MNRLRAIAGPLLATATLVAATLGVATPAAAAPTAATHDVAAPAAAAPAGLPGMDVSSYQGNVNWSAAVEQRRPVRLREGHRGHLLHQPVLRPAVQRLVQRRDDPRLVPLRPAGHHDAAPPRPTTSSTTAAAGRRTAGRCPARSTSSTTPTARPATG